MQTEARAAVRSLRDHGSGVRRAGCACSIPLAPRRCCLVASRVKERLRRPVIALRG